MDRVVESRRIPRKWLIAGGGAAALILILLAVFLMPRGASQTLAAERVTISTVERGQFDDFLPLRGRVTPLLTIFLDAVEGGRVEEVLVEDGAYVEKGQPLAVLSNSDLQLNVLARQTEVTQQLNAMRSLELSLAQNRLSNERSLVEAEATAQKLDNQYEREAALAERGFVAGKTIADTRADHEAARERLQLLRRQSAVDERLQSSQLSQLRASTHALNASLDIARQSLDSLTVRTPAPGQLTSFSIQIGQSLSPGERLGQIDSAGRNKLVAQVDEFYLGRVETGQRATATLGDQTYDLKVAKIYPQVRSGQFEVDFHFVGDEPPEVQRGQTLQLRLTLSDPAPALIVPNGSYYTETGGNWIFVVSPDGRDAVRRDVRLGRRNADYVEVLDGLEPGERVITSPYTGFADKDRLDLES